MLSGLYLTKFINCDNYGNLAVNMFKKNHVSARYVEGSIFGKIYL